MWHQLGDETLKNRVLSYVCIIYFESETWRCLTYSQVNKSGNKGMNVEVVSLLLSIMTSSQGFLAFVLSFFISYPGNF